MSNRLRGGGGGRASPSIPGVCEDARADALVCLVRQNTYGAAIETLEQVGKVVDSLYAKVRVRAGILGPGVNSWCPCFAVAPARLSKSHDVWGRRRLFASLLCYRTLHDVFRMVVSFNSAVHVYGLVSDD